MFVGWVYDKWEMDKYGITKLGQQRKSYMENKMDDLIFSTINYWKKQSLAN